MELLVSAIHSETPDLMKEGVRIRAIGDLERLPEKARRSLMDCIEETKHNKQITLILALSYSSRDELTRAVRGIVSDVQRGLLRPEDIDEELLWQVAYAELFFSSVYWPDFGKEALREALDAYASRERRFGKTSEQIQLED